MSRGVKAIDVVLAGLFSRGNRMTINQWRFVRSNLTVERESAHMNEGAGSPVAPVGRDVFRDAMSRLGAAVHIISTAGRDGMCGYTASAVCSVSDDPPTVLVCLNRASALNRVFKDNGIFCVNTLASGQQALSTMFASRAGITMADRFEAGAWDALVTGAPALTSALIVLDCRISSISEVGTHSVMFGEVAALRLGKEQSPLMYFKRSYHAL